MNNLEEITVSHEGYITTFHDCFKREMSPNIRLRIKVLELDKEFLEKNYIGLSLKERRFFKLIDQGDIIVLDYPINFIMRSRSTIHSFPVSITIERLLNSMEILSSKLNSFWRIINKFAILD